VLYAVGPNALDQVAVAGDVGVLHRRCDSQAREACDVLVRHALGVLDPVARAGRRGHGEGVERVAVGLVANRVHCQCEAVVVATRPEVAEETMRECAELDIKHVWMHRGPGAGSVSEVAAAYGRQHGIAVIDGGCPCMFNPTADLGHKAMRAVFTLRGNVPKQV